MKTQAKVMIIDDSSMVRLYYRQALEEAGFEVLEAFNGLEALEKLLQQSVDLLIVDINMPQMDGLTFLRALRSGEAALRGIPALVTSTEAEEGDIENAFAAGANYYLIKPIAPDILVAHAKLIGGVTDG